MRPNLPTRPEWLADNARHGDTALVLVKIRSWPRLLEEGLTPHILFVHRRMERDPLHALM